MRAEDVIDQWAGASDLLMVAPHSTQSFDMRTDCWDDAAIGEADVSRAVEHAVTDFLGARPPLIVGGFSQGAGLAVILAATGRLVGARGCIAVAPSAHRASEVIGADPRPPDGLRVVMLVGSLEPHLDDCQRLAERLRSAGAHVKLDVIDGIGHDYPSDFAQRLPAAVEWVLGQDQ
jgi:predicted esterase